MATTSNTRVCECCGHPLGEPPPELASCVDWLTRFLGGGTKQLADIYRYGKNVYGYNKSVIKKARKYVEPSIQTVDAGDGKWAWHLGPHPTSTAPQVPTEPGLIGTLLSSYPPKENHHGEEL